MTKTQSLLLIPLTLFGIYSSAGYVPSGNIFFDLGFKAIENKDWKEAVTFFQEALGTGRLNAPGRSVAYWNIHIAEKNLGNENKDMEALLGYIVYASLAIDASKVHHRFDKWIEDHNVHRTLAYSIALIQARWGKRNGYSCSTPEMACYVVHKRWVRVFKDEMVKCAKARISGYRYFSKDIMEVIISCDDTNTAIKLYFTEKNEH